MKPRNAVEREICSLAPTLPCLTNEQTKEALDFTAEAYVNGSKAWCSECGHVWCDDDFVKSRRKSTKCPKCNARLSIAKYGRKRVDLSRYYYGVLTTCNGYQVARTFFCEKKSRKNEGVVEWSIAEVFQIWMKPGMKKIVYGRRCSTMGHYYDSWCFSQPMAIRPYHYRHNIEGYLSRKVKLLPVVVRNGISKIRNDISYVDQVYGVMNDPKCEILAKANQWQMFREVSSGRRFDNDVWSSVRIAIRHGYLIEDASLWIDMVSMLKKCGKDIHNPKYVCPSSLRDGHDFAQRLNDRRIEKERQEEMRREMEDLVRRLKEDSREQEEYKRRVEKWIGKEIVCGEIVISPLKDILDFKKEGDALHHCVFSNGYYEREDCLILGARVNGKRTETIEIDTERWNIVQCRGNHNQPSIYHEQILDAVKSNLGVFIHAQ